MSLPFLSSTTMRIETTVNVVITKGNSAEGMVAILQRLPPGSAVVSFHVNGDDDDEIEPTLSIGFVRLETRREQ
jgi:hypothetical protein